MSKIIEVQTPLADHDDICPNALPEGTVIQHDEGFLVVLNDGGVVVPFNPTTTHPDVAGSDVYAYSMDELGDEHEFSGIQVREDLVACITIRKRD